MGITNIQLFVNAFYGLYGAVFVVVNLTYLHRTEPRLSTRRDRVMMEEIPLALILKNGMMGCPAHYWSEDNTLVGEWSVRIVAYGIAKEVAISGGVREIVFPIVLMHPRSLKEAVRVVCL